MTQQVNGGAGDSPSTGIETRLQRVFDKYRTSDLQEAAFCAYRGRWPEIAFDYTTGRALYEFDWDDAFDVIKSEYKRDSPVNMFEFKKVFNNVRRARDDIKRKAGLSTPIRGVTYNVPQAKTEGQKVGENVEGGSASE